MGQRSAFSLVETCIALLIFGLVVQMISSWGYFFKQHSSQRGERIQMLRQTLQRLDDPKYDFRIADCTKSSLVLTSLTLKTDYIINMQREGLVLRRHRAFDSGRILLSRDIEQITFRRLSDRIVQISLHLIDGQTLCEEVII